MGDTPSGRPANPADEDLIQYGADGVAQIAKEYPNRPLNHNCTLDFSEAVELFESLQKLSPSAAHGDTIHGGPAAKKQQTKQNAPTPSELRTAKIQGFMSRWRTDVGPDYLPIIRLILPGLDHERIFNLGEAKIADLVIQTLVIAQTSPDAQALKQWTIPNDNIAHTGKFAKACCEVIAKRPINDKIESQQKMRISEVNATLSQLAKCTTQAERLPIFEIWFWRMTPVELMWTFQIILDNMGIGVTGETFFDYYTDGAGCLDKFNVSMSLRSVFWRSSVELTPMQPYRPQLAQFPPKLDQLQEAVAKLLLRDKRSVVDENEAREKGLPAPPPRVKEIYIEEKLDGERMQLHMDTDAAGRRSFKLFSRKGKDYTALHQAFTQALESNPQCFLSTVQQVILDGEMVVWDPAEQKVAVFGTLKTIAIQSLRSPSSVNHQQLYCAFDILFVKHNGKCRKLTQRILEDRRDLLYAFVEEIPGRLQIHPYTIGTSALDLGRVLSTVIAQNGEGVVAKCPDATYRFNDRHDWMKCKPVFQTEENEFIECVIVGAYWGTGQNGGIRSSFLCGLSILRGSEMFVGAFKVASGLSGEDLRFIDQALKGKWNKYDADKPPAHCLHLASDRRDHEMPDEWIRPSESLVIQVEGNEFVHTNRYALGKTLRFPKFKAFNPDGDWRSSVMTIDDLAMLKKALPPQLKEDWVPPKPTRAAAPRPEIYAMDENPNGPQEPLPPLSEVFKGLTLTICHGVRHNGKTLRWWEVKDLAKQHGATLTRKDREKPETLLIGNRPVLWVKTAFNLQKKIIVKPDWLFDCIAANRVLPYEQDPKYLYYTPGDPKPW